MSGTSRHPVWTIVVAAGSGARFGAAKQFLELDGARVVDRSIATAARHSDGVVVVLPADVLDEQFPVSPAGVEFRSVTGADSRAGSVRNGLAAVPADAAVVLVHDAARPLASDDLYDRVVAAVRDGADAVAPAVAVTDTLRHRAGGVIDRDGVVAVQTPQGFRASALRRAHESGSDATDDVTVVEDDGGTVVVVEGEASNLKLTTPQDLRVASLLLEGLPR